MQDSPDPQLAPSERCSRPSTINKKNEYVGSEIVAPWHEGSKQSKGVMPGRGQSDRHVKKYSTADTVKRALVLALLIAACLTGFLVGFTDIGWGIAVLRALYTPGAQLASLALYAGGGGVLALLHVAVGV